MTNPKQDRIQSAVMHDKDGWETDNPDEAVSAEVVRVLDDGTEEHVMLVKPPRGATGESGE